MSRSHHHESRSKSDSRSKEVLDLKHYRDIAPESVSDERLIDLMKNFGKDDSAIKAAIQAMWEDLPYSKASEPAEWVATGKKTKKKTDIPAPSERGGGRGRGRSVPARGGPGSDNRGGRGGASAGRSSSVNTSSGRGSANREATDSKPASWGNSTWGESNTTAENTSPAAVTSVEEQSAPQATSSSTTTKAAAPAPAPVSSSGVIAWGSGPSLAQKLKIAEEQAKNPPKPVEPVHVPVESSVDQSASATGKEGSGKSGKSPRKKSTKSSKSSKGGNNTADSNTQQESSVVSTTVDVVVESVQELTLGNDSGNTDAAALSHTSDSDAFNNSNKQHDSNKQQVGQTYLNLGRFDKPEVDFKFGAFAFGDSPTNNNVNSAWADNSAQSVTVGQGESEDNAQNGVSSGIKDMSSQDVWGSNGVSAAGGLDSSDADNNGYSSFQQNKSSDSSNQQSQGGRFMDNKSSAPPGLSAIEVPNKNHNNRGNQNRRIPDQQQQQQQQFQQQQQQHFYQQQLPQGGMGVAPPGMQQPVQNAPGSRNGNQQQTAGVSPVGMTSMYGGYGLDGMYGHPGAFGGPVPNPSVTTSAAAGNVVSGNNAATGAAAGAIGSAAGQNNSTVPNNGLPVQQGGYATPPGMGHMAGYPPPPFFANPYYQGYYYNAQGQNYNGRGYGMYQPPPRGPYGADPYAAAQGMGGYGDMYGQTAMNGQFADPVYGQMPMHQHVHAGQSGVTEGRSGKNAKGQANANAQQANAVPTNDIGHAHYANQYGNPYNMRPDQAMWPYQQGGMQWNQQGMPFPQANAVGGYSQGGIPQSGRHDGGSRGNNGAYGNRNNSATSSTTTAAGANTGAANW